MEYLNRSALEASPAGSFQSRQPYPWIAIPNSLTAEGFNRLRETLPDFRMFQKRVGVRRAHGQGYHDRGILHYHPDLKLEQPWREFVAELSGDFYQSFVRRMLGLAEGARIIPTMEWYYAWQGCGVSPHCDARRKRGTQIFYFNTEADWQDEWGGHILILDDERHYDPHSAPGFDRLKAAAELDARGNQSLLFQRTEHSWHGVRPLRCPLDALRKLFIVTINVPGFQVWWRRVRGKDPDGYPLDHAVVAHSSGATA